MENAYSFGTVEVLELLEFVVLVLLFMFVLFVSFGVVVPEFVPFVVVEL